jgi:hypothetical protein
MSLGKFMKHERKKESPSKVHLSEISANDSASVGSAFLAVSFDEDYPQLVLKASSEEEEEEEEEEKEDDDDTTLSEQEARNDDARLGASYPHPATKTVASFEMAKKSTSCIPCWLNESIDKVWKDIDDEYNKLDVDHDVKASFDEDEMVLPAASTGDWVDHAVAWTFSAVEDSSVQAFSDQLFQPILKPICRFVDATEIPPCSGAADRRFDEPYRPRRQTVDL